MVRHILIQSLLLILAAKLPPAQSPSGAIDRRTSVERGAWSSETVSLFNTWGGLDSNTGRRVSLASPDGLKIVEVNGENVTLLVNGRRFATKFGEKTNAELGWAPDSRYFFLTWTDGGETGIWHTELYAVTNAGLTKRKGFEAAARKDFRRRIRRLPVPPDFAQEPARGYWLAKEYCYPNVVGSQWLNGSQELLVSVLVPNVGNCRYASEFNTYRLTVPGGKILERYTAKEAHTKFDGANLPRIAE
jgi:hypothetical protein